MKLTAIKNAEKPRYNEMMDAHFLYASIHHFIISPYTKDRNHP